MKCCCDEKQGESPENAAAGAVENKQPKEPCCDCCCKKCLPYDDGFMLTAQILSIVAFLVSWLWYVTLIIGIVAVTLMQVTWCCRLKKTGLIIAIVICGFAAAACIVAGILMIVQWKGDAYCHVFRMNDDYFRNDDIYYPSGDYCNEVAWAVVAFVVGALWAAAAFSILYFMTSGRYNRCEEECNRRLQAEKGTIEQDAANNNIELGSMVPIPAATAYLPPEAQENSEIAVPAASYVVSDSDNATSKE